MEDWVVHLGLSGTLERPWGPPLSQKMTKACLKSSDIPLTTFHGTNTQFPIVKSSHSAICIWTSHGTLDCPFGTIGDPGDPGMGRWGLF